MVSKKLCGILLMVILVVGCDTEESIDPPYQDYFVKYYGTQGNQEGIDMVVNADGSIVLLGNSQIDVAGTSQVYVVKIDPVGDVLWQQTFGGLNDERSKDIEVTAAGDLIVVADSYVSTGDIDVMILRIDQSGILVDSTLFGYVGTEEVSASVTEFSNGDFIVSGSTTNLFIKPQSSIAGDVTDAAHFRFMSDLTPVDPNFWYYTQGNGKVETGIKTFEFSATQSYFFGSSNSLIASPAEESKFSTYPLASNGFPTDELYYGAAGEQQVLSSVIKVPAVSGSGYLLVGTSTDNTGLSSMFLLRLRETLNFTPADFLLQQEMTFTGSGNIISAQAAGLQSSGFVIIANEDKGVGNTDLFLSKVDASLQPLWFRSFGGLDADLAGAVKELADGKLLVVGTFTLESQTKMVLMKLNANGEFAP